MRARGEVERRPSPLTNTRLVYFCTVICMWRYRVLWYNEEMNNGKTHQGREIGEAMPAILLGSRHIEKILQNCSRVLCQISSKSSCDFLKYILKQTPWVLRKLQDLDVTWHTKLPWNVIKVLLDWQTHPLYNQTSVPVTYSLIWLNCRNPAKCVMSCTPLQPGQG
jgi:hypothetical protein